MGRHEYLATIVIGQIVEKLDGGQLAIGTECSLRLVENIQSVLPKFLELSEEAFTMRHLVHWAVAVLIASTVELRIGPKVLPFAIIKVGVS